MVNQINSTEFFALGSGSAVWSANEWALKSAADFAAFDVVVIGDLAGTSGASDWTAAILNNAVWGSAVNGNAVIYGGDPELHAGSDPGAADLIQNAIRFAADVGSSTHKTGLFIALSTENAATLSPVDERKTAIKHLLQALGAFEVVSLNNDKARKTFSHPILDCITEQALSDWGQAVHQGFLSWPPGFQPLSVATDAPPEFWTPAARLPPGVQGSAYILAKGPFGSFFLSPARACVVQGQNHTVSATVKTSSGAPQAGVSVNLQILSGPNSGQSFPARVTDATGTASWTYTGSGGQGRDTFLATANPYGAACLATARAEAEWAPRPNLAATDPAAAEGPPVNVGVFTLSLNPPTSGFTVVKLAVSGTATLDADYTLDWTPLGPADDGSELGQVIFSPGQSSLTVTVTPLSDLVSEQPETVILRMLPDPVVACAYSVGAPEFATVTITSAQLITVSLTAVDSLLDESGGNPGKVRLTRSSGLGPLTVRLGLTGAAAFGADYELDPFEAPGAVTLPDGVTSLDVEVIPIPDTRSELPSESVILTVLADPGYQVGTPYVQTLNLLDDDPVSLPALGYKLTDLGAISSVGSYANGINTLPDGQGGWRGQVAGLAYNTASYPNYYSSGFRWNNGSSTYLLPPSGWGYQPLCSAYSINDASTTVGQSAFYYAGAYYSRACYWPVGQGTAVILNPLTTVASLENYALDLNQRDAVNQRGGLIVGHAPYTGSKYHAVVWIPNTAGGYASALDLGDIGDGIRTSYATAINDYAEVVGRSQIASGNNYHGFRTRSAPNPANNNQWEPIQLDSSLDDMGTATMTDAHTSELNDINVLGEMVGRGHVLGTTYLRSLYKAPYSGKDVGYYDLGVLGAGTANSGTESVANAISANGTIAGQSRLKVGASQVWRAFVLSNAGNPGSQPLVNLNDVTWMWVNNQWVLATGQGWTLVSAERINRAGWIVGYGTKAGLTRAFVLSPR